MGYNAEESFLRKTWSTGDFVWFAPEGEAWIVDYCGTGPEAVVPPVLDGLPVTSILYNAFREQGTLRRVILPDSVVWIGAGAFRDCTELAEVRIPEGTQVIGEGAFRGCSRLTRVSLPLCRIGSNSFENCGGLTEVDFRGDGEGEIPFAMFSGCGSLTDIQLPAGLRYIGGRAFHRCDRLEALRIPERTRLNFFVTPFSCWSRLEKVVFDGEDPRYRLEDGALYDEKRGLLICCLPTLAGTEFTAAPGTRHLAWSCFAGCSSLRRVILPPGVRLSDPAALDGLENAVVLIHRCDENTRFREEHGASLDERNLTLELTD